MEQTNTKRQREEDSPQKVASNSQKQLSTESPPAKRPRLASNAGEEKIAILDAGAQYGKVIDRRVRELNVDCDLLPLNTPASQLTQYKALILSGGPQSVYAPDAPKFDPEVLNLGKPVLGICYGFQLINFLNGGTVEKGTEREDGQFEITVDDSSPLFHGLDKNQLALLTHGDSVKKAAKGFREIGMSGKIITAIENQERQIYAVQFHPEVDLTVNGRAMLANFLLRISHCNGSYTVGCRAKTAEDYIVSTVGNKKVLLLVSGGVDSTVCAALLHKALGTERVICLHVDHGFMRKNESQNVKKALEAIGVKLTVLDAAKTFAEATTKIDGHETAKLRDSVSPEEKRKIIGDTFMKVTQQTINELGLSPDDVFLAQGTLRPDLIESASESVSKNASVIKTHHNDTYLVRQLRNEGRIIEPLKDYHKDEVRALGTSLLLPEVLVWRQPFPGPGLAIRIICAQEPYIPESFDSDNEQLAGIMSDMPDVAGTVLPVRTVGVQGDGRSYGLIAALSSDKTPHWPELLQRAKTIPRQIHSVNRVVFVFGEAVKGPIKTITPTHPREDEIKQLQEADAIVNEVILKHHLNKSLSQVPVVLFPVAFDLEGCRSIAIRTFITNDFMTGQPACPGKDFDSAILDEMIQRILTEVAGISRVVFDLTPKPPATTEWE